MKIAIIKTITPLPISEPVEIGADLVPRWGYVVGHIVEDVPSHVAVAQTFFPEEEQMTHVLVIPRGCISFQMDLDVPFEEIEERGGERCPVCGEVHDSGTDENPFISAFSGDVFTEIRNMFDNLAAQAKRGGKDESSASNGTATGATEG